MKETAINKLHDMIDQDIISSKDIVNCLYHYMSGDELNEFVEFVEDELVNY